MMKPRLISRAPKLASRESERLNWPGYACTRVATVLAAGEHAQERTSGIITSAHSAAGKWPNEFGDEIITN
jgi:hypothetical protein